MSQEKTLSLPTSSKIEKLKIVLWTFLKEVLPCDVSLAGVVVFSLLLPTLDTVSDVCMIGNLLARQESRGYGAALLLGPLLNMAFTLLTWWKMEEQQYRSWSWISVFFMVWPQLVILR